jgi:hypothetical protein
MTSKSKCGGPSTRSLRDLARDDAPWRGVDSIPPKRSLDGRPAPATDISGCCLEFFAEELDDEVADEGGGESDGEVGGGEDIIECGAEGLALACGPVEFAHEEVGVEEEDDEADLNQSAQKGGEGARRFGIGGHGLIV